jgi:hypothetical protein
LELKEKMVHLLLADDQKEKKEKAILKCVPLAKARAMSEGQRRSAVKRKRAGGTYRT